MTRPVLQLVSWLACAGTILPSILYLANLMTLDQVKWSMLAATIVWFVATPFWMGRNKQASSGSDEANASAA